MIVSIAASPGDILLSESAGLDREVNPGAVTEMQFLEYRLIKLQPMGQMRSGELHREAHGCFHVGYRLHPLETSDLLLPSLAPCAVTYPSIT